MILWFILFFLIIAISFVMALQSMKDFAEKPSAQSIYSLYLIKNVTVLTPEILDSLYSSIIKDDSIISIEKLFKGPESALVIFGPKAILDNFNNQLSLLELEDYTNIDSNMAQAWEVVLKDTNIFTTGEVKNLFKKVVLQGTEQFWWQITLQSKKEVSGIKAILANLGIKSEAKSYLVAQKRLDQKADQKVFNCQIRAVVVTEDSERRKELVPLFENLIENKVVKLPKALTAGQILEIYKQRLLETNSSQTLTSMEVVAFLGIN